MYAKQIKVLEQRIDQLKATKPVTADVMLEIFNLQTEVKKLRKLEWDEIYETVKMENDR